MDLGLAGRVAVVTGGAGGIGRVLVRGFLAEGAIAVALDRYPEAPEHLPEGARYLACDLTEPGAADRALRAVVEEHGRLDVLVNNAGVVAGDQVESMSVDAWRRVFAVNVDAVFETCQAAIPHMKAAGWGRILNAASFAVLLPTVGGAAYAASKAAVVQLTRVLASELGPWGITANSYAPGMVPTGMNKFADLSEADAKAKLDMLSIRRWGTPEEVSDLVCFLASERAGYITGALLEISGGKFATQVPQDAHPTR